jgi:macrolide-specific efflux system membrane fusion protein
MKAFCVIVCLALAACAHPRDESAPQNRAAPAVSVVTARAERFVETVPATGRFGAPTGSQLRLGFPAQGILSAVPVRLGDRVGEGDVLAELDSTRLSLAASQAAADERAAEAAEREARVDRTSAKMRFDEDALRRARVLYGAGVAPRKDVEAASAQLADDTAQAAVAKAGAASSAAGVASAQVRVQVAQRDVAQAVLRAPVSGTVVAVLHKPGETVDPSTPVVVLAPLARGDVTLLAAAGDLARVHAGAALHYTIVGKETSGTGTVVGVAPVVDPDAQAGNVTARVDRSDVPDGAMIEAQIVVGSRDGIVLPEAAIVADPETSATYVFVERRQPDGSARFEQREVRVEERDAGRVLVAGGVRPGDRVAAEGSFALLAPAGD